MAQNEREALIRPLKSTENGSPFALKTKWRAFALALLAASSASVNAVNLDQSVWDRAGRAHGLDPHLLYSVAIVESRHESPVRDGSLHPWPYSLNIEGRGVYFENLTDAVSELKAISQASPKANVDVGPLQISLTWHGHRVENPASLLDLTTAAHVGAEILSEAIASAEGDLELGVGRYHHWRDESRARMYGARVLAVYESIKPQVEAEDLWYEQ